MNRLPKLLSTYAPQNATVIEEASGAIFSRKVEPTVATFAPLHYEANYAYPLIIWCHGNGDSEKQLLRVMPRISMRNYVAVAIRGNDSKSNAHGGYTWSDEPMRIDDAMESAVAAIDHVGERFNISRRRVVLAGFGAGGTVALRLALMEPTIFAGAGSLCGRLPTGSTPFGRLKDARSLELMLAVGASSEAYPEAAVLSDLRLLHSTGIPVELHQYDCGDEICTGMLGDLDRFFMRVISSR